ncbi:hypothetical protein PAXRUDRAFT_20320 [Paxillus rubicundulus Ve08.2h10]|uniref:Uncharacterized protein n=1 Tax=Paxillus rubicundulus Ve08.2h10 TaxID=930991 RepID=A0A0D0DA12_9AGAM|nr:hypothetical protein PAXRUDRAFT_20320 [Paxillus rubicundulus Ve08.2h10]
MSHHFPDQTGFQHILEYIGLRCDFICWAAVSDTMDHAVSPESALRNSPCHLSDHHGGDAGLENGDPAYHLDVGQSRTHSGLSDQQGLWKNH